MLVRLQGGLGNQLFQLLAARYCQSVFGGQIKIYPNDLDKFQTSRNFEIAPLLKNEIVVNSVNPFHRILFTSKISKLLGKVSVHSVSSVKQLKKWRGQILNGYFQDIYHYPDFTLLHKLVREIECDLQKAAPIDVAKLPFNPLSCCAIHLRLTDFLQIGQGKDFLHDYRLPFIKKAVVKLKGKEGINKFIVFTDDVAMAKQYLPGAEFHFFQDLQVGNVNLLTEYNIISRCKFLITSNSTFSFWTSMLGGQKTIIFPGTWRNDDKIENGIFIENTRLHNQMFPNQNRIEIVE
jgi:hypothetical protein